ALAWHLRVPATNGLPLVSVTYGGGQFVAVGDNGTVATSNDGANWQAQQSGTSAELDAVAFANGNFVAAGSPTNLFASSNGTNWLQQNWVEIASVLGGLDAAGGRFFLLAPDRNYGTAIYTSDNGTNWSRSAGW